MTQTEVCDHGPETDCHFCLYCCALCGDSTDIGDDSLCETCHFGRAQIMADQLHDRMKEGD